MIPLALALVLYQSKRDIAAKSNDECTELELDGSHAQALSPEEIHACTTCNACVEACPVLINPLEPIIKMRRYEILTLSSGPADWVPLFNSLENNQAAWSLSAERSAWTADMND